MYIRPDKHTHDWWLIGATAWRHWLNIWSTLATLRGMKNASNPGKGDLYFLVCFYSYHHFKDRPWYHQNISDILAHSLSPSAHSLKMWDFPPLFITTHSLRISPSPPGPTVAWSSGKRLWSWPSAAWTRFVAGSTIDILGLLGRVVWMILDDLS